MEKTGKINKKSGRSKTVTENENVNEDNDHETSDDEIN